jgi:hypothetical protein
VVIIIPMHMLAMQFLMLAMQLLGNYYDTTAS